MNEVFILVLTYFALCFTENIPDPEARSRIGIFFIAVNAFLIMGYTSMMLFSSLKVLLLGCKRLYQKRTMKKVDIEIIPENTS